VNAAVALRPQACVMLADAPCSTRMSSADEICVGLRLSLFGQTNEVMLINQCTYWEKLLPG
jgi:hypothetical protein